jgi:hypothetical protein
MTTRITSANITQSGTSGISSVSWQAVQTTGFTAVAGNAYPCNTTSAAFTVTLPASPAAGNVITLTDYAGTFATNNLTIARNGNLINGSATNVVLSTNRASVQLVYVDATQGWVAYSGWAATSLPPPSVSVDFLMVAGGGGGGGYNGGGGGGAGGLLYETGLALTQGVSYSITVGASGSGGTGSAYATDGTNSTISGTGITTKTALKGGAGGSGAQGVNTNGNGGSGTYGSGGGVGRDVTTAVAGAGTSGQGFAGGAANPSLGSGGSGGGGAGGAGNASSGTENAIAPAGDGGVGSSTYSSLLTIVSAGVDVGGTRYIAGGGGGASYQTTRNTAGGSGGGGQGSMRDTGANGATAGTTNTGGGGGGGGTVSFKSLGQNGGSGIVIIKAPQAAASTTGSPTPYTSGGFYYYKFTGDGSITF